MDGHQLLKMSLDQEDAVSSGPECGHKSLSPSDERSFTSSDSRLSFRASFTLSDLHEELVRGMQEQFDREIEELRSENDYLKDELVELQAEMLEMRDEYLEEDMYQLQVLRQQLDQANKNCRILQYRLHKAERHCLKVAQTGRLGGEPLCTLEQDLKVAKDVSIRLRGELDSVERKRAELDQENIGLRERLLELEVARQVQQAEMDKKRENSLKRKGSRSCKSERKHLPQQEDSADLRCQLHFAKEESALMCGKLAKLARENEGMSEELARFRSLYGRVEGLMEGQAALTREAEVRGRLQLVEEEANLLSRRIVELEVENRGLRAEMEEMKHPEHQDGEWPQGGPISRVSIGKVDEQSTTLAGELCHGRERPGHRAEPENLSRGASKTVIHLRPLVSWVESSKGALVGCGFEDRTDYAHLEHGGLTSELVMNPALLKIQEQAYLLYSAICLLTASNSNHFNSPIYVLACPVSPSPRSPIEQGIIEKSHSKVHTLAHWLKTLQAQLQAFMEGMEVFKGFGNLEVQNGDALLSAVDSQDGESSGELKECQCQDQSKWRVRGQGAEEEIDSCEHREATCTQTRQGPDAVELGLVNSPLLELKGVLQELTAEMLVERRASGDLAQKLASAKSEWEAERTELQSQINQLLHGDMLEKSSNAGMEAKRSDSHRITGFSSSSTELRCALHPSSIHRSETPELRYQSGTQRSYQSQEWANPYKTWDGSLRSSSYPALDLNLAEAKRSQTAPERTGLRLYFSPPAMRRTYQTEQGPLPLSSSNTGWLPLEANLSDDMKERTHCTRWALEKRRADVACQTVGVAGSDGVTSVALQTEGPTSARPPRRHLSYPPGRVPGQSHCRSPKLPRRVSTPSALPLSSSSSSTLSPSSASLSTSSSVSSSISSCSGSSRPEGSACSPSWKTRGQNRSDWARSTLPRARTLPVGRSAGTVERGGTAEQPGAGSRAGRGVGGRPEVGTGGGHKRGIVQEFFRSVCGRGQLPAANGLGRGSSNMRGKMERAAPRLAMPPGSEGITSFVNKRLTRNSMREEPGRGGGALGTREKRRSCNAPEDTACDCTSRSLTFCFARPPRSRIPHAPSQCRLRSGECCQPSLGKDSQLMSDVTSGQSQ